MRTVLTLTSPVTSKGRILMKNTENTARLHTNIHTYIHTYMFIQFIIITMHPRCCRPPGGGREHRACIVPQAVTHSLLLLKMG